MPKCVLTAAAVLLGAMVAAKSGVSAGTKIPATDTFRDAYATDANGNFTVPTDRIRSDAPAPGVTAPYQDGVACVVTYVDGNMFFLRTAKPLCSPYTRALTLDFSDPVVQPQNCSVFDSSGRGPLDICGSNLVPDVRVIATSLFARAATSNGTPVIVPFSLAPDFSNTGFELDFEQNQPVTVLSPKARQLTASSLSIADLYQYSGNKKILLGRYRMPFQVTVQE